jgi:AcrR family transcriptional regulator
MKDKQIMSSRPRRPQRSLHEENVAATREHLLAAARKHFARHGYSRAEIARIAADARVTTGAVYHHFSGKKGLFQATAERIEAEIVGHASVVGETDPWLRLRLGFEKLVDFCATADVQRIIFVEAPQVVGPEAWREIEIRYAYGALKKALPAMIDAGTLKPYPVDLIARTLLALLREASAEVVRTKGDPKVRAQISDLVAGFFRTLEQAEPGISTK